MKKEDPDLFFKGLVLFLLGYILITVTMVFVFVSKLNGIPSYDTYIINAAISFALMIFGPFFYWYWLRRKRKWRDII